MNKHILVISQYFYPENFRINDLCKEWINRGYKVTVLTGIPNYPKGYFFKGYSWLKRRNEDYENIRVIRLPIIPRRNNSLFLTLNYLSFVLSSWFWVYLKNYKSDLVFVFGVSPLTQALPAVWYSRKHKVPMFLYLQDLWPENLTAIAKIKNPMIIRFINRMMKKVYLYSKKILLPSKSFVENLLGKDIDSDKIIFLPQYAEDFYKPLRTSFRDEKEELNIIFTGNIGFAQGLDLLPKVSSFLKEQGYMNKIKFTIVGDGRFKNDLINLVKKYGVETMFDIKNSVPAVMIPEFLKNADIAFLSFNNNEIFEKTIPAKLQSYLACGMPILASVSGESQRIITNAGCGLVSPPENVKLLYVNILKFYHSDSTQLMAYSNKSLNISNMMFNKDYILKEFDSIFKENDYVQR